MRTRATKRRVGAPLAAIVAMSFAVGLAGAARAATPQVDAFAQPSDRVSDTEPIRLTVRIQGAELGDVTAPRLPALTNLRVISGPSTQSQFSWVNGQASASSSFTWVLLADGPGAAEVPAVQVRIGSAVYRTEPIRLQVTTGVRGPRSAPAPGRAPDPRGTTTTAAADVFLRAELGASEVWVGQPVTLSVSLYSTVDVASIQWRDVPTLSNFWAEDVPVDPSTERFRSAVGGRPYVVYPLQKKILMATTSGEVGIEPYGAEFQVRRSGGDAFADFFNSRRFEQVIRKTDPLRLRVKPLPDAGRPEGFGGAVGSFRMRASLDRSDAQINEALALKVTVEGEGLLKSVGAPRIDAPPDLKLFEPKVTETSDVKGDRLVSRKTWEWVLVPLVPGTMRLPAPSFAFFDPAQGAYHEVHSSPMEIAVRKSDRPAPESAIARGEVRLQRQEINFIKPLRGRLSDARPRAHERSWFLAALLLPLAWVPAVVTWGRRRARMRSDRGVARAGKSRSRARKRLRAAEKRLAILDAGAFHEEVARALVDYVADRFDRSSAGLTYEVADALLESRGVEASLRERFRACLESCDFARYVPGSGTEARKAHVLREAIELVDLLEKAS